MVNRTRRSLRALRLLLLCAGIAHGVRTATAAIELVDDTGQRVTLVRPAERIVSLTPHLTELLFEAGAGSRVVGTALHSDFPPPARTIPRVGDARALDLERILALRPDLVVAWVSGNPRRQVQRLRALGVPVFYDEPGKLADIARTIERLGALAGTSPIATERATRFRERLAALRSAHAERPSIRVFYQIWDRPLLTVSAQHVIHDALQSCGARNIYAEFESLVPRPTREAVLRADPDAIIAADGSGAARLRLQSWARWSGLRAVRNGTLYTVDPDLMHRHSPRILEGVAALCARIDAARVALRSDAER